MSYSKVFVAYIKYEQTNIIEGTTQRHIHVIE